MCLSVVCCRSQIHGCVFLLYAVDPKFMDVHFSVCYDIKDEKLIISKKSLLISVS
jgi:hypothetical protein